MTLSTNRYLYIEQDGTDQTAEQACVILDRAGLMNELGEAFENEITTTDADEICCHVWAKDRGFGELSQRIADTLPGWLVVLQCDGEDGPEDGWRDIYRKGYPPATFWAVVAYESEDGTDYDAWRDAQ